MKRKGTGLTLTSWFSTLKNFEILLFAVVIFVVGIGWYVSYHYKHTLRQSIIASFQETQLEIVRSVARSVQLYIADEFNKGSDVTQIEQNLLKKFVAPVRLLKSGDAWIYTPDHVVFDLSSDFPYEYRNKSMEEIFTLQVHSGASHYEEMADDVLHSREGKGWYIWLPEKGPEIAAWTPVRYKNHVWTIGLSTPLFEILEATKAKDQQIFITRTLIFATLLCAILLIFALWSKSRRLYLENETIEIKTRLQTLLEALPDAIYFKDATGKNLLVNKAFTEIVGKNKEDILGKTDEELFFPNLARECRKSDEQVFSSKKPYHNEERFITRKNDTAFYETHKIPIFNNENEITGLVGISRDITERKRNEEALEKRIVALTRALDDVDSVTFEDLFPIDDIQRLQDEFSEATGLASVIARPDGTPITRFSNFTRLCHIIRNTTDGSKNCSQSDAFLGQYNPEGPKIHPCHSGGLWDAGAAISIGGRHIATWLVGQVRDETQSENNIRQYAHEIGVDEETLAKAFNEVPAMSKERFMKISQVLYTLANQLSTTAYQNIQQARFITERKKIENTLSTSKERYKALTELLPIGVIETDDSGNILFANQAIFQMTGYDDSDLHSGLQFQQIIAPEDQAKASFMAQQVLTSKITDGQEYTIRRKDGSTFVGFINSRVYIMDSAHRLIGYIFDLSSIKEKEKALHESEEKLTRLEKMESLGLLAGGVAHDLNNILSGIVSYPELLLLSIPESSSLRKPLETIKKSGEKAVEIVQDLLTMARRGVLVTETIDLNATIREQLHSPEIEKLLHFHPQVKINADFDPELLNIKGSATHIAKSIMNLVSNAAEAMPDGGTITITTINYNIDTPLSGYENVPEGDYAVLTISDTGTGMTGEDTEKIFEPFYTKKKMGKSGTGLGMAVVWGTVKDHNGFINLKSEEGTGTTFTLYLPATRDTKQTSTHRDTVQHYGNGEKILVVDDIAEQREIATAILSELRYDIATVPSGEEALRFLKEKDVDLVILDMIMNPGIDGAETFKRLREFKPNQRAIIASGFSITKQVEELQQLGVKHYVKKPYSIEKIGEAVRDALASS